MTPHQFTIVCATFNCGTKLQRTINSILSQDYLNYELVIIDGGSTDNTINIISKTKDNPRISYVSEPDLGVYDAMNKGIQRAQGRYLFFIGGGDELAPGSLTHINQILDQTGNQPTMIYGDVIFGANGPRYDGPFSKLKLCQHNICHQAIFYSADIFRLVGNYNLKYRILADWEFNMRCFGHSQIKKQYTPYVIAIYEAGGMSIVGDTIFTKDLKSVVRKQLGLTAYITWQTKLEAYRLISKLPLSLIKILGKIKDQLKQLLKTN